MRGMFRFGLPAAIVLLASAVLFGCGSADDQNDAAASTTAQSQATAPSQTTAQGETAVSSETTATTAGEGAGAEAETDVIGRPADFPADVPLYPGTVTDYVPMPVTETVTVHQLVLQTTASLDDVIEWYNTKLPSGWSVGFLEKDGGQAKIALTGGSYTPASPDGLGGGVLVGLEEGDKTIISVTVTVMAQ